MRPRYETAQNSSGPRPGDFPIGSPESRAAARMLLDTPLPGAPKRIRLLGTAEYRAHLAALKAGKVFSYHVMLDTCSSVEEWQREVAEEMARLDRERAEEKARKTGLHAVEELAE